MTTIGLSYSLVKISTKCAPALAYKGHHQAEYGKAGGEFLAYRHGVHGMSCIWVIKWHSSAPAPRGASTLAAIHSSHSNLIRIGTKERAKRVSNRPSRGTESCIGQRGHHFRIFSENKPGADGGKKSGHVGATYPWVTSLSSHRETRHGCLAGS